MHSVTENDVRNSTRFYRVLSRIQETGERFPVLIGDDGIPPALALRYSFRLRTRGSASTLEQTLRDIGTLYEYARVVRAIDLDEVLREGHGLSPETIWHAAEWADLGRPRELAGIIRPDRGSDILAYKPTSPATYVRRMRNWHSFLRWTLYQRNWGAPGTLQVDVAAAERRQAILTEIDRVLEDLPSVPAPRERRGMNEREVCAIEYGIGPDANGVWPAAGFSSASRLRNYVLYLLGRYGGLRRSEMLVLEVSDLPRHARDPLTGARHYTSTSIKVPRRPDSPNDPRAREPRTKRRERRVPVPTDVLDVIWDYVEAPMPAGRQGAQTSKLIVSEAGAPLSIDRTDDIMEQMRRYASAAYAQLYPGDFLTHELMRDADNKVPHSLGSMSWHRLRYTAAEELLPQFINTQGGLQQFLEVFGWADLRSASPYLRRQWRAMAEERMQKIQRSRTRRVNTAGRVEHDPI